MNLLFYRACHGDWLDKSVALFTLGPFSHVELQFSGGICFSSSFRDGGTRFKAIEIVPERWEVVLVGHLLPSVEQSIRDWCQTQVGLPYDIWGVLGFGAHNGKWFCSEVVTAALRRAALTMVLPGPTPNRLYRELQVEWGC